MTPQTRLTIAGLAIAGLALTPGTFAQPATGSLEGRVTFEGTPPPPIAVAESGGDQKVLHVDRTAGLRYALVHLPDTPTGGPPPSGPATMDQRSFVFVPQVMAVRAGQPVRFVNSDSANHNVRSADPNPVNAFSLNTADSRAVATHAFAPTLPDRPVVLGCDIHPWMVAWVYAFPHDGFAVTGPDGRYRIDGIRPGRHRLAVRQPAGRLARDLAVEVVAGETSRMDVRFTRADVGMPAR